MSEQTQDEPAMLKRTDEERAAEDEAAKLNTERLVNGIETGAGKDLDNDGDVGVEGHDHPGTHAEGDQVVADKPA